MANMLRVSGVHAHWNRRTSVRGYDAMRGVSFDAADGAWVTVLGDNGVGKSTLFHAIAGTAPFVTGAIYVNDVRLPYGDIASRFEWGVLHVRQDPALPAGDYWVKDAVALATTWRPALKNDRAIRNLLSNLEAIGLVHGERCTADAFDLIACIVAVPRVIMLDEARARMAGYDGHEFYARLRPLIARSIVLFTEHHTELALSIADSVVWLRDDASPRFGVVAEIGDEVRNAAPVEEGPREGNEEPMGLALRAVSGDQSIRDQTELAVQCARGPGRERLALLREILRVWSFLDCRRPAETLSGGERITLAWLLLHASGLGAQFPSALTEHLSDSRRAEILTVKKLIEG
jgi:ABC-type branched-subunit amino acid transport system ATPase component